MKFISGLFGDPFAVIYVTYGFLPKIKDEAMRRLEAEGIKVFAVRPRDVEKLDEE